MSSYDTHIVDSVAGRGCESTIWPRGGGWHRVPCSRKGVVEEQGKWWCKQHAPSAEKKRRMERDAKFEAKWAASDRAADIKEKKLLIADACLTEYRRGGSIVFSGKLGRMVAELDGILKEGG